MICFWYINKLEISIHALRVEGDGGHFVGVARANYFYPRPPGGGRLVETVFKSCTPISIHALRVEGDGDPNYYEYSSEISIHALRVEGDMPTDVIELVVPFISIHALRVEGDLVQSDNLNASIDFYPRPPGGGRPREIAYETYAL